MRESKEYLVFFQKNIWRIIAPALVLASTAFYYQKTLPVKFIATNLIEINSNDQNINQRLPLADEAVILIRTENIKQRIGIPTTVEVKTYKNGPLLLHLSIISNSKKSAYEYLEKATFFLLNKYPASKLGETISDERTPPFYREVLTGFGLGLLLGLSWAFIKEYFERF